MRPAFNSRAEQLSAENSPFIGSFDRDERAKAASLRLEDGRWDDAKYRSWLRIKARLSSGLITLAYNWTRVERYGWENFIEATKQSDPYLIVAWHGSLMIPIYCFQNRKVVIMTSLSRDGDLLTQALYNHGFRCVRGSSSRGGMRGLLEMARLMKNGANGAITVDGPRGPRHEVKPGAVLLAKKAKAFMVPIGLGYSNCKRMKNWDQTEVPLPGSKAVIVTGKPFRLEDDISLEDGCREIQERIFACEKIAEQRVNS